MDILIEKENEGKTIRALLRGDMGYSSGMLKKLKFSEGGILVNGEFKTVRYELREGDILSIACEDTDEDVSPYIIPSDLPIGIAYEDELLTVIDKPSGMPAHPSYGHRLDTVANALAHRYGDAPYVFRPVNRLDRDTSGLMITANSRLAAYQLYRSMIAGEIKKVYVAILRGHLPEKSGSVLTYVTRCEDSIVQRRVCSPNDDGAKDAHTVYRVVLETDAFSVVLASPITGRTHQLRMHFAHLGCPIEGDTMYGYEENKIERHALHAVYTEFPHPNGEILKLSAPLPYDMRELLGDDDEKIEKLLNSEIEELLTQVDAYEKD